MLCCGESAAFGTLMKDFCRVVLRLKKVGLHVAPLYGGLTDEVFCALRDAVRQRVGAEFRAAGAHYVIDSVADLLPVLELIEQRLARGERP